MNPSENHRLRSRSDSKLQASLARMEEGRVAGSKGMQMSEVTIFINSRLFAV